jgi:hypothetical protein
MIIHSKESEDCSGGGGGGYSLRSLSKTMLEHSANVIIYVDHKDGVHIHKNRYGPTGKASTEELVNILCHVLAEHVFNGNIKLFQEGMRLRLKKAINRIMKKG